MVLEVLETLDCQLLRNQCISRALLGEPMHSHGHRPANFHYRSQPSPFESNGSGPPQNTI